jgi:hypothetical protein
MGHSMGGHGEAAPFASRHRTPRSDPHTQMLFFKIPPLFPPSLTVRRPDLLSEEPGAVPQCFGSGAHLQPQV